MSTEAGVVTVVDLGAVISEADIGAHTAMVHAIVTVADTLIGTVVNHVLDTEKVMAVSFVVDTEVVVVMDSEGKGRK